MARLERTIFISYRRKDISWALAVYQYLTSQTYDVFFDFSSLSSGDFEQVIISNIRARAHFLLILTPTALDRCSEPGDWLRREIETAIDEKRNIIPLFFDGFNFGSPSIAEKLTGKLASITRYNGLEIPPGYFIEAMERLSERYLNVPLNAVIHPVSTEVRKAVKDEQIAVGEAISQKWEDIKELIKPAQGSYNPELLPGGVASSRLSNRRLYGIGVSILALIVAGIIGFNTLTPKTAIGPTPTITSFDYGITPTAEMPLLLFDTATVEIETLSPTAEPTITITPVPTLGVGSILISDLDKMTMVYVPAGEFTMGLNSDENDNPAHLVTLAAFWIDQTEVTNAMYALCDAQGACQSPSSVRSATNAVYYGNPAFAEFPVINVTWDDAKAYCDWAGRRLPTEAEWEKAARGTDKRIYPWGNENPTPDLLNYLRLINDTEAVGDYPAGASPYKAFDMAGNVWEWVGDYYDSGYYLKSRSVDPSGPLIGQYRVIRGGSWIDTASTVRVVHRYSLFPSTKQNYIGFRCAMDASK